MLLFVFTFFVSLLEVVRHQLPLSSRIAIPAVLAIGSGLIYNYAGIKEKRVRRVLPRADVLHRGSRSSRTSS